MTRSKIRANGYANGEANPIKNLANGTQADATRNLLGPVKTADGINSPTKSTTVTDITIAAHDGTNSSKNNGNASFANEFANNKLTNTKWWGVFSTSGNKRDAYPFSLLVPVSIFTRKSIASKLTMPIVNPAAIAANDTHINAPIKFI
mmetsp:Transcript_11951/g.14975  ORF Transcript_11951/g.14975 Transcript_11951/m.14975 type:complete len:148 (-) Transcript_11951:175-618(-)